MMVMKVGPNIGAVGIVFFIIQIRKVRQSTIGINDFSDASSGFGRRNAETGTYVAGIVGAAAGSHCRKSEVNL